MFDFAFYSPYTITVVIKGEARVWKCNPLKCLYNRAFGKDWRDLGTLTAPRNRRPAVRC